MDSYDPRHSTYSSPHDGSFRQTDQSPYAYDPRDSSPGWERRDFQEQPPHQQPIQQPLRTAIGNAFDKSDAARVVDPDLIAQITAQVKRSVLDEIKLSGIQPVSVTPEHYVSPSPASVSTSIPPRDVYTPPSPKHADFPIQTSPTRDPIFRDLGGADDTPTPRYERSAPIDIPQEKAPVRPAPPPRMETDDYTPIEKMWQRLFDPEGQPLPRLGEFLRGLALHLIEDYEPKKSLVISPAKMLKFYEQVMLQDEIYPWQRIFGSLQYTSLSKIYRDMRCQHHLIQEHPAEIPHIPALTPEGFQEWMTAMIQAYPDAEYERMAKAVLDMPISNAEDRKERFPKELPRRMLPAVENLQAQQRCAAALSSEGVGPLRKAPTFPPPPPKAQPAASGPTLERERSPYATRPDVRACISEEKLQSSSVPIERERKPYSSVPGAGKNYDGDFNQSNVDAAGGSQRRRAQSTSGPSPYAPPPNDTHNYPRSGSHAPPARPRSPSFSGYGAQSEPNIQDIPGSYYSSNLHKFDDDSRRYSKDTEGKKFNQHRRSTAGMETSFDPQPRSVYDDDDYHGRHGSSGYEGRGYESRRY